MGHDPMRMCELLAGLGEVDVLGVDHGVGGEPLMLHVRCRAPRPLCAGCGGGLWSDGGRAVVLVDLPVFGRPVRLVWRKGRWRRPDRGCGTGSVTQQNPQIAPRRALLTTRAARWATRQVGQGRPVGDAAAELGCCRSAASQSVLVWGQGLLDADVERIGATNAAGLDETLFCRGGRYRRKGWRTGIVDASGGRLLDVVAGRTAKAPAQWLLDQPRHWRDGVRWAALDLSGPYRAALDTVLPHAAQVADPFHVIRLADNTLDDARRRAQNQTLRHRGREGGPLYRSRKLLLCAHETVNAAAETKLLSLLEAGDPRGEARDAWHAKETCAGSTTSQTPNSARSPSISSLTSSATPAFPKKSTG